MTPHPDAIRLQEEAAIIARSFVAMQRRHEQAYPRGSRPIVTLRAMLRATTAMKFQLLNS